MLIEINRKVLEQFVKDKEFMYQLVNNWIAETNGYHTWFGLSLRDGNQSLTLRSRGSTQISIKYYNYNYKANCTAEREIEKRIIKYKKL